MPNPLRFSLLAVALCALLAGFVRGACPEGDLTGDCRIGFDDLQALARQWLHPAGSGADLDSLNGVESRDFAMLAREWRQQGIPLVINEVMASNGDTIRDPQGENDDWIEIYNPGPYTINIGGMYLTDEMGNPTKWQIPTNVWTLTRISPGRYLIIWIDNDVQDNRGSSTYGIHAGFELNADGDQIALFDATGTVLIDSVSFQNQTPDISYGRYPNGSDTWRLFGAPSPGRANTRVYAGIIEDVEVSHKRGFYETPFTVTLACETDGVAIYYTLDGSDPYNTNTGAPTGTRYTGPLTISGTTCLRAAAMRTGWKPSRIATHTYIFVEDVVTQSPTGQRPGPGWPSGSVNGQSIDYGMDPDVVNSPLYKDLMDDALLSIPSISLVTDLRNLFDPSIGIYVNANREGRSWERPTSVELLNPDGTEGFQVDAGLRIRGGFSRSDNNPKHAFRLLFRAEYGAAKLEYPMFGDEGVKEFDNLDLRTSQNYSWAFQGDSRNTMVREVTSRDLQGLSGHPYTRSRYYHLYINGQYWGLFQTQERSEASFAEAYFGGRDEDYDVVKADRSVGREMWATDGNKDAYNRFYNLAMSLRSEGLAGRDTSALYYRMQGLNVDGTPNPAYEYFLDVDNLIDFMIIEYYTGDRDGPGSRFGNRPNNTFCIYNRVKPDGWKFFHHDNEHTLGAGGEVNMVQPFTTAGSQQRYFNPHWLHEQLAQYNRDYRLRFADHVYKHFFNDGLLTVENVRAVIQKRVDTIDMAIIAESARWGDAKRSSPFTKHNAWLPEINNLLYGTSNLIYVTPRIPVVLGQFKAVGWYPDTEPPTLSHSGGAVPEGFTLQMVAPAGTIYYTLDGTDPRVPTAQSRGIGTVSPKARAYTGPITLHKSAIVKARALTNEWSPVSEAKFSVGPIVENLRITEVMYHPPSTGDPADANEEFIELKNIGTNPINLHFVRFSKGIDFTFGDVELAGGEYILLVKDRSAFDAAYPQFSGRIAGQYRGSLDNAGERIELVDVVGRKIADFSYSDNWRKLTDGGGYSLTISDPNDLVVHETGPGLVRHWKFDDGSGDVATDSASGSDGTLIGGPAWTEGRVGGALRFDGVDDQVALAPIEALAGDNVTVEAWVYLEGSAEAWNPIITQHVPTRMGYYLYVYQNHATFSLIAGRNSPRAVAPDVISPGQWYHIAGTNDGTNLKIYVNGVMKVSLPSATRTGVDYEAVIGHDPAVSAYFQGLIDDVRVYNRALSEDEFASLTSMVQRWNHKDSWRASAYSGGSPGYDDSGIVPDPGAVVISEVLAHSHAADWDWIELHNTTDADIDIGGWFLSDNTNDPKRYRIADGTQIPAHGYLVFYEYANFGTNSTDPGRIKGFALSEDGDQVSLRSATPAGELTGYRVTEDFGASQTAVSFGKYFKRSTGNYNFVLMEYMTPWHPNSYPLVGPVVISEIMYHPDWPAGGSYPDDRYEYIELHNITTAPVKLYRDEKQLPWRFTEGIEFTFPDAPQEVTIPPDGRIVLVRDPAAFKWRYPDVPEDKIFGPYEGRLANDSERIELSMPGDTDKFGRRHYIKVDRVAYSDGSHPGSNPGGLDLWPKQADGAGMSLTRIIPAAYGNDPNNWQAAAPSPGQ